MSRRLSYVLSGQIESLFRLTLEVLKQPGPYQNQDLSHIVPKNWHQKPWQPLPIGFRKAGDFPFFLCPFELTAVLVVVEAFLSLQGVELEATQVVAVGIGGRSHQRRHAHRKHGAEVVVCVGTHVMYRMTLVSA